MNRNLPRTPPGAAVEADQAVDAVACLVEAHHRSTSVSIPTALPIDRLDQAYDIQEAVAARMGWFHEGGARHWKSGGASRESLQTHAPLPPQGVYRSPARIDGRRFKHCQIEIELALRIGTSIDPATAAALDVSAAAALVDAMAVSIEIVDTRWREGLGAPSMAKLADLQAHGALILGDWMPWQPRAWAQQVCDVRIGSGELKSWKGTHSMGDPAFVLPAWIRHVTRHGSVLPAGTVVTTGSWCGMLPAKARDEVHARFEGIGEARVFL